MSEVTTGKLFDDFKVLIDDVEQLVSATAGQAGERTAELRQRMSLKVEQGREALAQCEKELHEQAEQAKQRAIIFVLEESWSRLAAAACLGALLGLALRRLKSKSTRSEQ
jgi:ElaB/YqjD/DUF883 family membrane-anchored ribosome-binding protein